MKGYKCKRCGYVWTGTKDTDPKACPRCKSYRWNEAKKKAGRKGKTV